MADASSNTTSNKIQIPTVNKVEKMVAGTFDNIVDTTTEGQTTTYIIKDTVLPSNIPKLNTATNKLNADVLPIASSSQLGGIKIGTGLKMTNDVASLNFTSNTDSTSTEEVPSMNILGNYVKSSFITKDTTNGDTDTSFAIPTINYIKNNISISSDTSDLTNRISDLESKVATLESKLNFEIVDVETTS